jgi:hypothetical protein
VFFDAYNPGAVDSKFATLIEQRQEEIDVDGSLGNYFEGVFSFYDTDKFLRYDETADEKAVGNAYESYLPSSYTDGVAYLTYTKANVYEMYLDYTLSETAVTADIDVEILSKKSSAVLRQILRRIVFFKGLAKGRTDIL